MDFSELMLYFGALSSFDQLVDSVESSIKKYREASKEEDIEDAKGRIEFSCSLLLSKSIAPDVESAETLSKEFQSHKDDLKVEELLNKTIKKDKS